jgi:sulfatase maturation enzyme AslB (radical SAM superfamily)
MIVPNIGTGASKEINGTLKLSQFVGMAELSSGRSIVWSGLTGFVGILNSDLADQLKTRNLFHPDEMPTAIENEGLFYKDSEDGALVDVLEKLARKGSKPTNYRLVLTGNCDLTCSYCIQAKIRKTMNPRLSPAVIDDVVKYVEYNSPPGPIEILLMGGEPLYNVEVAVETIKDLCREFSKSGRNYPLFKLLTNGLNLSTFVESIGSFSDRINSIQVSIDQDKEIHDSVKMDRSGNPTFDRAIRGAKCAVEAGIHVTLRMNIHRPDLAEKFLQTCDQLYDEIGSDKFTIYPALVIQRPLAKNHPERNLASASSAFSRLLVNFFLWHHGKTGHIHSLHIPHPRWINCYPKLGPPSMLGSRGEVRAGPVHLNSFPGFLSEVSAIVQAAAGSCSGVK